VGKFLSSGSSKEKGCVEHFSIGKEKNLKNIQTK
jgi:hypothetical protein